jgi:predicted nucleic acid-binding protein
VILVDPSVWVDHLRAGDPILTGLLNDAVVLTHPLVIGELAMGSLRQRGAILIDLGNLPQASAAEHAEVMRFVEHEALFGRGIGWVDAHLLAATRLTPGAALWTKDRRLAAQAERLAIAFRAVH